MILHTSQPERSVMSNGLLFASSRFFILALLVSCSLSALSAPFLSSSESNLYLSLNLHKREFPGRTDGPRRCSLSSSLSPYLKVKVGLYLSELSLCAGYLVLLSGDVSLNPGPDQCAGCLKGIRTRQPQVP